MENKHYYNQVELWVMNGRVSHDELMALASIAYEYEQKQDAKTNDDN